VTNQVPRCIRMLLLNTPVKWTYQFNVNTSTSIAKRVLRVAPREKQSVSSSIAYHKRLPDLIGVVTDLQLKACVMVSLPPREYSRFEVKEDL